MFDPYNPVDANRLRRSIKSSEELLKKYRDNRKILQDALFDPCHGMENVDTEKRAPVNPLDDFFQIMTRAVVDQNPSLRIVRSKNPRFAGVLKSKLQTWSEQSSLASTLQELFHELLMRWLICFTGYQAANGGVLPFAAPVDFDDYFIDLTNHDENDIDFEGHCYCKRYDELLDSRQYIQSSVAQLKNYKQRRGPNSQQSLYDRVELRNVFLPRENLLMVLIHENCGIANPIRISKYEGPPWGPYIRADMGKVRGSLVPNSRASFLYDLHQFVKLTYRHLFHQADAQLEAYGFLGERKKDAEKHRTLRDGEYVGFEGGPETIWKINKGGINQGTLSAAIHASNLFNEKAGNISLVGGLAATAPTARQEAALGQGVTQMVADARGKMSKVAMRIYETATWYFMRDPTLQYRQNPEQIDWTTSSGIKNTSPWHPSLWQDLAPDDPQMEIIPGSMVSRSAEEQLQALIGGIQTTNAMMALPGDEPVVFKHREFRRIMTELGNMPELDEVYGEAPDQASVVPGADNASIFAPRSTGPAPSAMQPSPGTGQSARMMMSAAPQQPTPAATAAA